MTVTETVMCMLLAFEAGDDSLAQDAYSSWLAEARDAYSWTRWTWRVSRITNMLNEAGVHLKFTQSGWAWRYRK